MVSLKKSRGSRARRQLVDCEFIVWQSLTVSGPILFLPLVLALVAVCCLQHCNTATGQRSMAAIFAAVKAFDAEALRRELAAGGNPDIYEDHHLRPSTPLNYAVCWQSAYSGAKQMRERLECITVLLEAGASVDLVTDGRTPLHWIAGNKSAAYQSVIAMLLEAGADPNFTTTRGGESVLATAASMGSAGTVRMLLSAGAVDLDRALESAIENGKQRNCTPLLRAGAAIPWHVSQEWPVRSDPQTLAYIRRIRATWGGFKAYEKAHRQHLAAIFLAKFPVLPVEMLERIVEFSYNVGGPSNCPSIAPKYLLD